MSGRYRTIVADPPWSYRGEAMRRGGNSPGFTLGRVDGGRGVRRSEGPYKALSVEAIRALPVSDLADENAHLYLWTTNTHLRYVWEVCEAWGFRFSTLLVWCKAPMGAVGFPTFACNTEFVAFARRGSLSYKERSSTNWWQWRRGQHSAKPDAFLDVVEQVSPGPYAELFARRARFGWSYPIGDEALGGVAA